MATLVATPFVVDEELKRKFALALARTDNAATAAMSLIPDPGEALKQSYLLPNDPVVLEELERIRGDVGEEELLPSKAALAKEILSRARDCKDNEEYGKLMKLHCEMRGFIEKPGNNVAVDVKVAPVMVVRDHGSDEEWAAKIQRQQRELTGAV